MNDRQHHALCQRLICFVPSASAKMLSDHGIDTDAKTNGHCIDKILDWEHQRKGCHGILTDLCHKITVYNVVKRIYRHGDDHRKGHR